MADQHTHAQHRPEQQPQGQLSRDRIFEVALGLVDEAGYEKLTMRGLATALGVDPMATYYYVPNKSALLDGLVERVWATVPMADLAPGGDATAQLVAAFARVYRALVAHPNVLPLVATRSIATPQSLELADRAIELLQRARGFAPAHALSLVNTLAALTIGRALAEAAPAAGGQSLAEVADLATQFPRLTQALSNAMREADETGQLFRGAVSPCFVDTAPLELALRAIIEAW